MSLRLARRLWIRSAECHHLSMLIVAWKYHQRQNELCEVLSSMVAPFLAPDVLIIDSADYTGLNWRHSRTIIDTHMITASSPSADQHIDFGEGGLSASVGDSFVFSSGVQLQVFDGISGQRRYVVSSSGACCGLFPSENQRVCWSCVSEGRTGMHDWWTNLNMLDLRSGEVSVLDQFNSNRPFESACLSPSGNQLVVTTGLPDESLEAFSLPAYHMMWKVRARSVLKPLKDARQFQWFPDEDVIVACDGTSPFILDAGTGKEIRRLDSPHQALFDEYRGGRVTQSVLSKQGTHFALLVEVYHGQYVLSDRRFLWIVRIHPDITFDKEHDMLVPLSAILSTISTTSCRAIRMAIIVARANPEILLAFEKSHHSARFQVKVVDANTAETIRSVAVAANITDVMHVIGDAFCTNRRGSVAKCNLLRTGVALHALLPGTRVEVHSLSRMELNGKCGRIQGWQGDRVQVIFDDLQHGGKALKPSNVRVLESVESLPLAHIDPPARIEEGEAAEIVAQQEAGWIEVLATRASSHDPQIEAPALPSGFDGTALWMVELKRCPHRLFEALSAGRPLQACRSALEAAGHSWILPDRNLIFVSPGQYRAAMRAIVQFPQSTRFSIFFVQSFEHLIDETLSTVGQGAIGKSRHCRPLEETDSVHGTVDTDDLDDVSLWRDGGVQRTFVHLLPCHLDAASVVQSSTEAHGGGTNPRRVARD